MSQTVREYLSGNTLRNLAYAYSGNCWEAWKAKKTLDKDDPTNPFLGGPAHLLDQGINEIEGADGKMIKVGPLSRIRFRQLSDAALDQLGILHLKGTANPGGDVIHQEYVDTFEENVANDVKHLMNNFLAAAAIIDGTVSYVVGPDNTVEELAEFVQRALGGDPNAGTLVGLMSRAAWIGRACMDGSWKDSSDFVFGYSLSDNTAAIDPYVAEPVLKLFMADIQSSIDNS